MENPQKERWISFKGCEFGCYYYQQSDVYIFYTAETVGNEYRERKHSGEFAAQSARIAFLNMIESLFNNWFKKKFIERGFDPVTGKRIR